MGDKSTADTSTLATLEEMERAHIIKTLESTRWRVSGDKGAAKILGINPYTLELMNEKTSTKGHK